jgi:hypothetical protein
MSHSKHDPRRFSGASLFAAVLLAGILVHASTASAATYHSRTVHRGGTVYHGGTVHRGGSVHYASRPVARPPIAHPPVHAGPPVIVSLPRGYTKVRINGVVYYKHGGVHYRPYYQGTRVVYRVVTP